MSNEQGKEAAAAGSTEGANPNQVQAGQLPVVKIVGMVRKRVWAEKDIVGTVHIYCQDEGDEAFDFIQIQYDHRHTSNAHQEVLTQKILGLLGVSADEAGKQGDAPAASTQDSGAEADGWFDVDGYSTKQRWEGPDPADRGLDGFMTLGGAIDYASSDELKDCYEVVISAWGKHKDHETGERVWSRYKRE